MSNPIIAEVMILDPSAVLSALPALAIIVKPPKIIMKKMTRPATI